MGYARRHGGDGDRNRARGGIENPADGGSSRTVGVEDPEVIHGGDVWIASRVGRSGCSGQRNRVGDVDKGANQAQLFGLKLLYGAGCGELKSGQRARSV